MSGMSMLLVRLLGLMLLAVPAAAQPAANPGTPARPPAARRPPPLAPAGGPVPRIVIQASTETGIDVAAWAPDGRQFYTATGLGRQLLVWDGRTGVIIDRLRLPAPVTATSEFMRLYRMTLSPDGNGLTIDGEVLDVEAKDRRAARRYEVDLRRRRVVLGQAPPLRPLPAGVTAEDQLMQWASALQVLHFNGTDMSRAEAEAVLPALPALADGRRQLVRTNPTIGVRLPNGTISQPRTREVMGSIGDAELSPDDRLMAILTLNESANAKAARQITPVEVIDLGAGAMLPRVDAPGSYDRVSWLDARRYAILPQDEEDDPAADASEGVPDPTLIVEARTGRILARVPSRCFMQAMPDGRLIGAGLANCRRKAGRDRTIAIWDGSQWESVGNTERGSRLDVRRMAVSPRGDRVAVLVRLPDGRMALQLSSLGETESEDPTIELEAGTQISLMGFSADGSRLWIAGENSLVEWNVDTPFDAKGNINLRDLPVTPTAPQRLASNGNRLMISGPFEEFIRIVDLAKGEALRPVGFPGAGAVGYMRSRSVVWAASSTDGIRFWDQRSGSVLFTINLLPESRYVAVAADARYDTNAGPDADLFRWIIPDQPDRSLPPQTLMRDFYEPRMIPRLLACSQAGNCATVLHKVPSVTTLNRELPVVQVKAVRAVGYAMVEVDVEVQETRNAATGTNSGVYGVKLLMNNREVARNPDEPFAPPTPDLPSWRQANFTPPNDDQGRRFWTFTLPIPTDGEQIEFSAYSFNADRVKSDTARLRWTPPPLAPRPRRAYVLTIGVNDYKERRLKLTFAAADAELIANRLQTIPGYEVRRATLTSAPDRPLTAEDIGLALRLLAGPEDSRARRKLAVGGHDVSALAQATPDDVVIISFSGHGYADPTGAFALLASDAKWGLLDPAPDLLEAITAEDLTMWLRAITAREIAFIIDACHSGAAVNSPDFKPGPMGDPGLGQLAFDKGLRILAATQANSLAMENEGLKHGFLTYALGEGLNPGDERADADRNGKVLLDEWLRYAVRRVPSLGEMVASGNTASLPRGVLLMLPTQTEPPRTQEPSLFDFNRRPSRVAVRGQP